MVVVVGSWRFLILSMQATNFSLYATTSSGSGASGVELCSKYLTDGNDHQALTWKSSVFFSASIRAL